MESEGLIDGNAVRRDLLDPLGLHVLLLEVVPDGALRILDLNEAARIACGYAREELVGQPLEVLCPESASPKAVREHLRGLASGQPLLVEARHRRKDGSVFLASSKWTLFSTPRAQRVLSVGLGPSVAVPGDDPSHSHALLSYIISHARSAIAVHDRELRYIYVSERYLNEYKVTERDVIGRHHYDVFPDLPQKWRDVHRRALRGEVSSAEEDPYERADGSVEWTRWECRPWYEPGGAIGGIVVYTEVITERKRAEEERKSLERQLQQAMKMEAVGRLAGGVAHDFNNLLTAITGNVDLALMGVPPDGPVARRLREIAAAAESAASLTRQLLAFSRKQVLEPRRLDLSLLVARLEALLRRLIGEDVALQFRLTPELRPVLVDPGQIEQVLVNLAVNGRDAMPSGGELTVETAAARLDPAYCSTHPWARPGDYVTLVVTDTGQGMSEDVKRHLFEPFFTTKARGRGTGLGLATTFGIVKQAGGSIEVDSAPGQGTRFRIYLPAVEGAAEPLDRASHDEGPHGHGTVLLVEDDAAVRHLAADVLEQSGYVVIEAADAAQALEKLARHEGAIDLLLTDVVMPGMNGRILSEKVLAVHPGAKVLFASGYTENVIAHHGVLEHGVHFLAKPYTPGGLASKVREVLSAPGSGGNPLHPDAVR